MNHFTEDEFACPCCGDSRMDAEFTDKLDRAREAAGRPFVVTSGKRCESHHREVYRRKGLPVNTRSRHPRGGAADIAWSSPNHLAVIVAACIEAGIVSMAINKAEKFIHLDNSPAPHLGIY